MNTLRTRLIALLLIAATIGAFYLLDTPDTEQAITTEIAGVAMAIPYRVVIGQELSPTEQNKIITLVHDTFQEVDQRYNQWNPDSELSRLNALPAHVEVVPSPQLQSFLHLVDKLVALTNGRFDPTIEPLKNLWTSRLNAGTLPQPGEIAALKQHVGWHHIKLGESTFRKDNAAVALNVDAVAKGFAVDLLVHALTQAGYPSSYVEWGGEIKAAGKHPAGRPWRVYIRGIESSDTDNALAYVELEDAALATSGDYHQNWTISDQTYCHVFDPVHLSPVEVQRDSVASASVLASSCAAADALATAAVVCGSTQQALTWADEVKTNYPSLTFWIASRDQP